jgi:hypothetical protein
MNILLQVKEALNSHKHWTRNWVLIVTLYCAPPQIENLLFSLDYFQYDLLQSCRDHDLGTLCLGLIITTTKTLLRRTKL